MIRVALLMLAAQAGQSAQAEDLRIGASLDYPPYLWIGDDGTHTGLDAEILDRICAVYTCEIVPTNVSDLIPRLRAGEIDAVIGGIGNLPSREAVVDFTCPYDPVSVDGGIFVGPDDAPQPEEALISVTAGTAHALALADAGFKTVGYPDIASGLQAVQSGAADLYFGSPLPIDVAQSEIGTDFSFQGTHPLPLLGAAIAVAENNPVLLASLNEILAEMSESGDLQEAQDRWLGRSEPDTIALCNTQQLNSKQGDFQ